MLHLTLCRFLTSVLLVHVGQVVNTHFTITLTLPPLLSQRSAQESRRKRKEYMDELEKMYVWIFGFVLFHCIRAMPAVFGCNAVAL